APKKSYVVLKCPVFEVQDYWPCKNSYIVVNLHRYCHFPTAHDVEVEIPPTRSANIRVKMASSQHDRIRCTLTRIAGKATACSPTTKTPTYPEEVKELRHGGIVGKYPAEVCVNMMANPIVKITSPPRDEMDTTMDIDIRYRIMSVPKMVHFLWCQSFDLNTDCSKESLYWFDYNTRLCGRTRHREFEYKYGAVEDAETYSLRYRKSVGVSQGSFACYIYREPRPKGTYTLDLFSSQSATIEKDALKRMFHHRSQTITYNVLAPPDSVVTVTCPVFNVQSDEHCSDSYLKINDVVFCNANQPGTRTVELTYNNAVIVFRDGTNANNNFRCIFQRGESSDACAVNVFNETTPSLPLRMSTMFTPETELPTTSPGFGFTTLTDLKRHCDRLDPSQRVIVAFEIARFLKTYGTKIPHNIVVQAVSVFLCAIDHKSIITKLFPKEAYVIGIAETVVDDLTPPDLIHLIHLLYAERNISAVEESPCAGILCEEVPESIMDTIDMLVDRYFPNSAPQKKWLIIDIARALNLQPEVDEDGDEMVYYKLGDYGVVLDELREPMLSEDEKALLTGKFFAEARKNAKANRKINVSDLEEVWKMGEGNLPLTAVRSFIALLKVVHAKKIALEPKDRARLLEIALRCDGHECTKLPSRDIHNLIFALCNVGIRDGFALSKEVKKKVSDFIVALKDAYIDSISLRRWKRSSELLKPKAHDYLSESSPSELKYLKGWLQAPINLDDHHFDNPGQGRSLSDPQVRNKTLISELFQSYTNEKSPKRKAMLAETLLDSYNHSFRILGAGVRDTEKFIVSVLRQLPATTTRQNSLVLGILDQCIGLGEPCINVTRPEDVAPLKVILQNMSLERSPNLVSTLAHKLEEAGKRSGGHFDLSWMQPRPSKKKSSEGKVTKQKSPLAERMKVPS
ncbi:hypothetical protein HPB47_013552, partial [Ixodes persulcatus]